MWQRWSLYPPLNRKAREANKFSGGKMESEEMEDVADEVEIDEETEDCIESDQIDWWYGGEEVSYW